MAHKESKLTREECEILKTTAEVLEKKEFEIPTKDFLTFVLGSEFHYHIAKAASTSKSFLFIKKHLNGQASITNSGNWGLEKLSKE